MPTKQQWYLVDCQERNRLHPDTFDIPGPKDIAKLKVGELVKLVFEPIEKVEGPNGERMWVRITERNGDNFKGELRNYGITDFAPVFGSEVAFEAKHIAST